MYVRVTDSRTTLETVVALVPITRIGGRELGCFGLLCVD